MTNQLWSGLGQGFAFGRAIAEANPGVRIGLIPAAVGGSSIYTWRPGAVHEQTNTRPYDDAVSRVFRVMALYDGELKGIIWHQGESDRNHTAGYEDALVELIQRFRTAFQTPDLPFVAARLARYYTETEPGAVAVNEAIDRVQGRLENVAVIETSDLGHKGDGVHLDAVSSRELGKRYAKQMRLLQD